MKEFILNSDRFQMNWVEGNTEWGTVKCALPLEVQKKSERNGDVIKEEYVFTNHTERDIFTKLTDIGIYTPFHDDYTTAGECMTNRCHTHIWCGGEVSYVMALRMGGQAPHLGLVLTSGALRGYSVERDLKRMSNDRGDFILHPEPFSLAPGESYTIAWTLFPHSGKTDFYEKASEYCSRFLAVRADSYLLFKGESTGIEIKANASITKEEVAIALNGKKVDFTVRDHSVFVRHEAEETGEMIYQICVKGIHTFLRLLVLPKLQELAEERCRFITEHQQFHKAGSHLDGAYLIYDREEKSLFYSPQNDYNGGRERVGMGLLLAYWLQRHQDENIERSLLQYAEYVRRELVNEETGEVYNDCGRDDSYRRLYNSPWYALFYTELYQLYKNRGYLTTAYRILKYFYENGGTKFYAIELPAAELIECMKAENMSDESSKLLDYFKRHADFIAETGTDYPAFEVNYEQSIVAPAADILFQAYAITRDEKYLAAGTKQLRVLELFNANQPDYHLNETAIRHWDGYWFGKRRMYGDTYPHYWSSLTGIVYREYADLENDSEYAAKANASLRAALSLFHTDGTASCAYVYPAEVNGKKADYAEPYANDQDWGMYFALKYL